MRSSLSCSWCSRHGGLHPGQKSLCWYVCAARCYCHLPFKAPRSLPLSPSPSANTFLWLVCNTFYQLRLWLTCVFGTFLCLLALWQRNSTVWTLPVFPVSQLLGVSKACLYYVGATEFLKPSQGQPGLSLTLVMLITVIVITQSLICAALLIW